MTQPTNAQCAPQFDKIGHHPWIINLLLSDLFNLLLSQLETMAFARDPDQITPGPEIFSRMQSAFSEICQDFAPILYPTIRPYINGHPV